MVIASKKITVRGKEYRIDILDTYETPSWTVYRLDKRNPFYAKEIPCFTRAEERAYPKTIAKIAHQFCLENTTK